MGLIGNDSGAGCAPLGVHLLGEVRQAFPDDGVTLSDPQSFYHSVPLALTDGVALSDSPSLIQNRYQSLADGVTLSEDIVAQVAAQLADGVTLGEALSGEMSALLADGVELGDDPVAQVTALLADGVVLGEVVDTTQAFYQALTDGVVLDDGVVRFRAVLTDEVVLAESPVSEIDAHLADGVVLDDGVARFRAVLTDDVVLSDPPAITVMAVVADGIILDDGDLYFTVPPEVILELQALSDGIASHQVLYLREGEAALGLVFSLTCDGQDWQVPDDATVRFRMRARDAEAADYAVDALCLRSSVNVYEYTLVDGDTDTPGEYYADLVIEYGSLVYATERFVVRIVAVL